MLRFITILALVNSLSPRIEDKSDLTVTMAISKQDMDPYREECSKSVVFRMDVSQDSIKFNG